MTYVKKSSLYEVKAEAKEYARFQHRLARLTKINEKIRSLLEKIRDLNCREVDEYRKVAGGEKYQKVEENERGSQGMDKERETDRGSYY